MMQVFGRQIEVKFRVKSSGSTVEVDTKRLNIGFTIERNLDLEPSTALITIHNLSKSSQELLKDAAARWEVSVSAGYGYGDDSTAVHELFKGDVRLIRHRREPPILATDVEADDGGDAVKKVVTRHFGKGTTVGTVFRWLQEQSGLGAGNVARIDSISASSGLPNRLENGITVKGPVMEELGDLAKSRGVKLSSQNNEIVILQPGEPLAGLDTVQINSGYGGAAPTGLIGYPYVDNEGILTLNHRMIPNLVPGAPVEVKSEFVNNKFVVERATYSGSLWEQDFNVEIEARQALS